MTKNVLVIGDTHIPFEHKHYLAFCKRIEKEYKCSQVVHIGDLVDNHALSFKYESDPDGHSPKDEISLAKRRLSEWFESFPNVLLCRGNHDCFRIDTEFLTSEGWRTNSTWRGEQIAQFDKQVGIVTFANPISHIPPHKQETVTIEGFHTKQVVSINHDVVVLGEKIKAKSLVGVDLDPSDIRTSGQVCDSNGIDIEDRYLKLAMWLIFDGTLVIASEGKKRLQFKLSKGHKIRTLCSLLSDSGVEYTFRKATKSGINKLQPYYITVYGESARIVAKILDNKKRIPQHFRMANLRQTDIVLDVIANTDGSSCDNRLTVVSIEKENLDILQEMCIRNGYSAKIRFLGNRKSGFANGKPQWCMTIYFNLMAKTLSKIECRASGVAEVFGFEMPMGTMITRIDGKVAFSGNCRVNLKGKHVGLPNEVFRPFRQIWNLPKGWKDSFDWVIGGVKYLHGTLLGDMCALKTAFDNRMSCVVGHSHSVASVHYSANNNSIIWGMAVGCGINRDSFAFAYDKPSRRKQILACGVVSYTNRGTYPTIVPMEL